MCCRARAIRDRSGLSFGFLNLLCEIGAFTLLSLPHNKHVATHASQAFLHEHCSHR